MSLALNLVDVIVTTPAEDAERRFRRAAWSALATDPSLLDRNGEPAHFTASALPVSADGSRVCLVLHRRMGLWVQPGGHFEPGDGSVAEAAAREMTEETGLVGGVAPVPLALSRHASPCGRGDWHLDVQMLAVVAEAAPTISEESLDVAWFGIDDLPEKRARGVSDLVGEALRRLSRTGG
ncbi:MAG: NUDIX domain-containing protein [Acidimicrobiia bacterium]